MKGIKINNFIIQSAILVIAVAVLGQNLFLLRDNRALRQSQDVMNAQAIIPAGKILHNLAAVSPDGRLQTIAMPEETAKKILVITFSPGCPYCRASQAAWMDLSKELKKRPEWRVLWVSRDPISNTIKYCNEQQIPLDDTVADPTYRTYMQLELKSVPNTLVVGTGGRVEKVWAGQVDKKEWDEIVSYFNLQQKELPLQPKT
jgi:peroxiredoxin